jgi:ABC-2 type transport system ATP-binding protein
MIERGGQMKSPLAIEITDLTKAYGKVQALRGLNLEVKCGEILGFLGPNGAGKTTTIRCLLDLIRPQSGNMRVLGIDPTKDPVAVRALIGYLPGELHFEGNLTVIQALRYFDDLRGNKSDWKFVDQLTQRLKLDPTAPIKNLSKGNRQKVGLVQALMARPELLLLDEPTSGLDPLMQQEVYRLLKEAKADGATVFFSSHVISEVEAIAGRVAIIRQGVVVEEAEPRQLISMSLRQIWLRFREQVDIGPLLRVEGISLLEQHNGLQVTLQVEGEIDPLIKALAAFPVSDLQTERLSLEETFLAYYKDEPREES